MSYIGEVRISGERRAALIEEYSVENGLVTVKYVNGYREEIPDLQVCRVHDPEENLPELAETTGILKVTLHKAYEAGRLLGRTTGHSILSTQHAIWDAIKRGDINPHLMKDTARERVESWLAEYPKAK